MDPKPLPIFRLPAVPLKIITRFMVSTSILLLSLASKKAAYIMRSILPRNSINLQTIFWDITGIFIDFDARTPWTLIRIFEQSGLFRIPVFNQSGDVISQWEGPNFRLNRSVKSLISHFAIAFHPTIAIHFGYDCSENFMMEMMNHVKHLGLVKTLMNISMSSLLPANYKFVLDECKHIVELRLFCKVSPEFQYRAGPDFKVEQLVVGDGHWMHLEDFSNSRKVTVYNNNEHKQPKFFNLEVLRALIRKWIESEDDCLPEQLKICSDFERVLTGLEYTLVRKLFTYQTVEIIRRSDGKKAVVKCGEKNFQFNVVID